MTPQFRHDLKFIGGWVAGFMAVLGLLLWFLAMGAVADAAKPAPPPIPRIAAELALVDGEAVAKTLGPEVAAQRRWIWCPDGSPEERAVAVTCLNIAVSHSPVDYCPPSVAGGALVPVDLRALLPEQSDFEHGVAVWNYLSNLEHYFHVKIPAQIDGKWFTVSIAAPHLGAAGIALERLVGNEHPEYQSYCPIVRADWFTFASMASIDGAQYLNFRGLTVGKTKLNDYLKLRGVPREEIEKDNADERAALISGVTGNTRAVRLYQSHAVRPSVGQGIVMVTDDHFNDDDDPGHNPFASLLDAKKRASETILTQANGFPEYTVWDGEEKLLAEAAANVVSNHRVPEPFLTRLQTASCIGCHGPFDGWQPFRNEVKDMYLDRGKLLVDLSGNADQAANQERIASLYTGDLSLPLKSARDTFDRRIFATTSMSAKHVAALVSSWYASHEFQWVGAKLACKELGFAVPEDDPNGTVTFRRIVPAKSIDGRLVDDPLIIRLHTDYLNEDSGKRVGLQITRREWENIYADCADRSQPALNLAKPKPAESKEKK